MTKSELFEEIRSLLKDVQVEVGGATFTYPDADLVYPVRSALRWARTKSVDTTAEMSTDGELSPEPTEPVGVLLAYRVASQLLRGDMVSKLGTGELGLYFRAGDNIIDTKTVASTFRSVSTLYGLELDTLLTQIVSENASGSVFGDSTLSV